MKIPNLDNRDSEKILDQIKSLAKQYVPEWRYDEEDPDFGVVFSKIFADMFESTITRYNRTSYNNYISFLNLMGAKLLPPTSAAGMIKVTAVPGSDGIHIDKGTSLYASADNEQGKVFYQTQDSMFVTPAKLKGIFMTDKDADSIVNVYDAQNKEDANLQPFRVFDTTSYKNLQSHVVYFENEKVFETLDFTDIEIDINNKYSVKSNEILPGIFSNKDLTIWQYYKEDEWHDIEDVQRTENGVRIKFDDSIDLCEIMGKESRYVRCLFKKVPEEDIKLSQVSCSSSAVKVQPEICLLESDELAKNDFFPFGEQYSSYTSFYISSTEALGKAGAKVDIELDMQFVGVKSDMPDMPDNTRYKLIMTDMDFDTKEESDVEIERVVWEYWNGEGWSRIYEDDKNEDFFIKKDNDSHKKVISFICPKDVEIVSVGSKRSRYIRARIVKVKNQFNIAGKYITPYIHNIDISYNYGNEKVLCKKIFVESNLQKYVRALPSYDDKPLLTKIECEYPAIYMCFDRPLTRGPIRILFDIERGIYQDNPSTRYEYYCIDSQGNGVWKNIDAMDLTDNFAHSEIVSIIGKNDFGKAQFGGLEGYFIRIINHDKRYHDITNPRKKPIINGIHFNTVSIIQKETVDPEYFYINKDEENKICDLSQKGICELEVWVNEKGSLSTVEQERFINNPNPNVRLEYDSKGTVSEVWIKWDNIDNITSAGMTDRVYEVDYSRGRVIFGNGRYGKIPTSQPQESIMIEYSVSLGSQGNVDANEIKGFTGSVPYINSVENIKSIVGGVDMETIESAAKRVSCDIKGMNRIVSIDDFESTINCFDRNINKVKCIPHVDKYGNKKDGAISIVILPKDYMQGYEKFLVLSKRVQGFIEEKAPATLVNFSKVQIFEALYLELSVRLEVVITDYNMYQNVYQDIYDRLESFLNPITGNFDRNGWDIGQVPRKELIYNYIKNIENIKWIKSINIFAKLITPEGKKDIDFDDIRDNQFIVPVFGEPEINMSID